MPRLNPLPDDDLGSVAETLGHLEAGIGYVPNSLRTLARKPDILNGLLALVGAALSPGEVSAELKNMLAEMTSNAAGCAYCQAHMAYGSKGAGVSPEKEAALWEYETSDLFTAAERAALHVARGAGQVPNAVTDEDFDELKKHYSDEQIVEILAAISTFGFFNRYNDTLATELESSPLQAAKEILEPRGWDVGKHG